MILQYLLRVNWKLKKKQYASYFLNIIRKAIPTAYVSVKWEINVLPVSSSLKVLYKKEEFESLIMKPQKLWWFSQNKNWYYLCFVFFSGKIIPKEHILLCYTKQKPFLEVLQVENTKSKFPKDNFGTKAIY